ncbi:mitogen-activated protein kinase 20-like [Neltuma alba]|uniref:mitogen-activated protein kinase 20-like n=1 Tax=Neltuma alba TaxID=207710 RepID=UPI0010A4664C|nr:mitogen-activated protein kinase 20-like [Prosopis alba]
MSPLIELGDLLSPRTFGSAPLKSLKLISKYPKVDALRRSDGMVLCNKLLDTSRSTVVHSNIFAPKEQSDINSGKNRQTPEEYNGNARDIEISVTRSMQGQLRVPIAKPGKVAGPVVPYEYASVVKDSYDPSTFIRGLMLPSQAVHIAYCYHRSSSGNQERSATTESDKGVSVQAKHPHSEVRAKIAPDIAINIDTNPFFMTRAGVTGIEQDDRIAMDTNLMPTKAQYGRIGAATTATTAHRKVGPVQYGMTAMF